MAAEAVDPAPNAASANAAAVPNFTMFLIRISVDFLRALCGSGTNDRGGRFRAASLRKNNKMSFAKFRRNASNCLKKMSFGLSAA
jgi:hypothetical protein